MKYAYIIDVLNISDVRKDIMSAREKHGGDITPVFSGTIREIVKEKLLYLEWSKYKLAQESGVAHTTIYDFLENGRGIGADKLDLIFESLNINMI